LEPPPTAAEAAFARELERHRPALAALLRRVVGRADLRGDALQEACARAWRFRGQYDATRPIGPWLATIALRVARELDRRRRRRKDGGEWSDALAASLAEEGITGGDPLELLERREEMARLDAALADLGEPARRIVARFYREGATVEQLARELAMPVNTVKSHLRRARLELARRLRGPGEET
jgi:RNA polymerase sigma-70 factor (ECF subfamily)